MKKQKKKEKYSQSYIKDPTAIGTSVSAGIVMGLKLIFNAFDTGVLIIFCNRSI